MLLPIIKFFICQIIMYMLCVIIRIIRILMCLEFLKVEVFPLILEGKRLCPGFLMKQMYLSRQYKGVMVSIIRELE